MRSEGEIRFKDPFEFDERFVIEGYVVNVLRREVRVVEAKCNGLVWEPRVMLLSTKPFFLRCSNDLAVDHKSGGAVMIKSREAKNPHC